MAVHIAPSGRRWGRRGRRSMALRLSVWRECSGCCSPILADGMTKGQCVSAQHAAHNLASEVQLIYWPYLDKGRKQSHLPYTRWIDARAPRSWRVTLAARGSRPRCARGGARGRAFVHGRGDGGAEGVKWWHSCSFDHVASYATGYGLRIWHRLLSAPLSLDL